MTVDRTASERVIQQMRILRRNQGLSAAKLGDLLEARGTGLTRSVIANMESGRMKHVSIDHAAALADLFGIPLDRMLMPMCETCANLPPAGFTCNDCGATNGQERTDG